MKVPLTKACIDEADISALRRAVDSKAVAQGELTRLFEERFARYLGVEGAVAANSATSALVLALRTLDIGPGDEVLIPTYTCLAVLNAVKQAGASPRLTDVRCDPARMDYNITPDSIKKAASSRTKAVIVPHMFGVPAEMDGISELGIPVIEDITLSVGARCKGIPVGGWSDLSVCSFHESKMITSGEGGMLASRDRRLLEKARRLNGWEEEQAALRTEEGPVSEYSLRYNFHMSGIAASLGMSQLEKLDGFVKRRQGLARRYAQELSSIDSLLLPEPENGTNVFFRFMVGIPGREPAKIVARFMERGIEAGRGVYPPLHMYLGESGGAYPNAQRAVDFSISLPLYPALTDEEAGLVLAESRRILAEAPSR